MTTLVSIQNIGPEKYQEGVSRGPVNFSALEKIESPSCLELQSTKTEKGSRQPFLNFSGPIF